MNILFVLWIVAFVYAFGIYRVLCNHLMDKYMTNRTKRYIGWFVFASIVEIIVLIYLIYMGINKFEMGLI